MIEKLIDKAHTRPTRLKSGIDLDIISEDNLVSLLGLRKEVRKALKKLM